MAGVEQHGLTAGDQLLILRRWSLTTIASFQGNRKTLPPTRSAARDTYQQWATLPHIPASAIQPGDLLFYDGIGHVSMYVGNGYIIDAPQTGMDVQKIPMNTGWYAATFIGAVRP